MEIMERVEFEGKLVWHRIDRRPQPSIPTLASPAREGGGWRLLPAPAPTFPLNKTAGVFMPDQPGQATTLHTHFSVLCPDLKSIWI